MAVEISCKLQKVVHGHVRAHWASLYMYLHRRPTERTGILGCFLETNLKQFSDISDKEFTLARYTKIFENFSPGICFPS